MTQEKQAVLEEVRFISIRRYANFEGCKFHLFTFRTADAYKIKKLRDGKLFGKDYKEVDPDGNDKEPIVKTITDEIAELEAILKQKKTEAGITEDDDLDVKEPEVTSVPSDSVNLVEQVAEGAPSGESGVKSGDQFNKMIDVLDYNDLKAKVKEAMDKGGVKINLNSGKEALRNYLKGK